MLSAHCSLLTNVSTNVERLFSYASLISDARRKNLLPERLEKILLLRENLNMLSFNLEW